MAARRGLLLAFLPVLAAGALACASTPAQPREDKPREHQPSAAQQQPRPSAADPNAVIPDAGATVLIDPGTEPRALLRYHPQVGDSARWTMVMVMDTTVTLLGETTARHFGIELSSETEVIAIDEAKQEHQYRSTIVAARLLVEPINPAAVEAALAPYIGLEHWYRTDARGKPLEYRYIRDGAEVDPSTIPGLDNAAPSMVLPEEVVGIGARWQAYHEVERNGFRVLQTGEHELVRRDGDMLEIRTTVSQQPLSRTMRSPDMPPGARIELQQFQAAGSGASRQDLRLPIPVVAQISVELAMGALIFVDQEQAEMTMQMRLESDIRKADGGS